MSKLCDAEGNPRSAIHQIFQSSRDPCSSQTTSEQCSTLRTAERDGAHVDRTHDLELGIFCAPEMLVASMASLLAPRSASSATRRSRSKLMFAPLVTATAVQPWAHEKVEKVKFERADEAGRYER